MGELAHLHPMACMTTTDNERNVTVNTVLKITWEDACLEPNNTKEENCRLD